MSYDIEQSKQYREQNKERIKEQRRAYYERHKQEIKDKAAQYYDNNKDAVITRQKKYETNNKEQVKLSRTKSRVKHKERVREESKRWRESHSEEFREMNKLLYYKDLQFRLFDNARQRAKRKQVTFTITQNDIIVPDMCPVFKVPFVWGEGLNDFSPSLDRIKPELGYVAGNIIVISNLANRIKNNATPQQVMEVALFLQQDDYATNPKKALSGEEKAAT